LSSEIVTFDTSVTREGTALAPDGDPREAEGVLNPAVARTRDGRLLMYPRVVAEGNVSRIGIVEIGGTLDAPVYRRIGFALEPQEPYEFRDVPGGYGCEDPRVTFIPILDSYVMAYTAFGPNGPRIAFARSHDGYSWERLGLADFSKPGLPCGDDKDAAFFPEPVRSPHGVESLAFYHRPMLKISSLDGCAAVPLILSRPPADRECIRVAYVPLAPVLADIRNIRSVAESEVLLPPDGDWGRVKNGAGTPPIRIAEGWMSLFHGVDVEMLGEGRCKLRYSAGMLIHDAENLSDVRYRSPQPLFWPETPDECVGIVQDVVFPTGIDVRGDEPRDFDVFYGMADARIGRVRLRLGDSVVAGAAESAA
jgi:beta-1,2-mannobiose phosphorylase / 1,2-beta-oligomannan phosphorylase